MTAPKQDALDRVAKWVCKVTTAAPDFVELTPKRADDLRAVVDELRALREMKAEVLDKFREIVQNEDMLRSSAQTETPTREQADKLATFVATFEQEYGGMALMAADHSLLNKIIDTLRFALPSAPPAGPPEELPRVLTKADLEPGARVERYLREHGHLPDEVSGSSGTPQTGETTQSQTENQK